MCQHTKRGKDLQHIRRIVIFRNSKLSKKSNDALYVDFFNSEAVQTYLILEIVEAESRLFNPIPSRLEKGQNFVLLNSLNKIGGNFF